MAAPESPEREAELQRSERRAVRAGHPSLGAHKWLWLAFAAAVIAVIALAYGAG